MENISNEMRITTGIAANGSVSVSVSDVSLHTSTDFSTSYALSAGSGMAYLGPVTDFSTYQHA